MPMVVMPKNAPMRLVILSTSIWACSFIIDLLWKQRTARRLAICCIAKDEDKYIDEWIEYHLGLGFDKIYVFRDDWDWVGPQGLWWPCCFW